MNFLPGLALNHDLPDLNLPSSPPHPGAWFVCFLNQIYLTINPTTILLWHAITLLVWPLSACFHFRTILCFEDKTLFTYKSFLIKECSPFLYPLISYLLVPLHLVTCSLMTADTMQTLLPLGFFAFTHTPHPLWSYMNLRVTECYNSTGAG
jgi:hypothetical protein